MDTPEIKISLSQANHPNAVTLIQELEDILDPLYPNESRHGYSVAKLLRQGVRFFILRANGVSAACGGVQFYAANQPCDGANQKFVDPSQDFTYAELKRMYVRPDYRGRGYAKRILQHLTEYALDHDIRILRLETGVHQHEAIGLYQAYGFMEIAHFGDYTDDPLSIFLEKDISNRDADKSASTTWWSANKGAFRQD